MVIQLIHRLFAGKLMQASFPPERVASLSKAVEIMAQVLDWERTVVYQPTCRELEPLKSIASASSHANNANHKE